LILAGVARFCQGISDAGHSDKLIGNLLRHFLHRRESFEIQRHCVFPELHIVEDKAKATVELLDCQSSRRTWNQIVEA
jgi:hypothetical protein